MQSKKTNQSGPPLIRSIYNRPYTKKIIDPGVSKTQQEFKEEADITNIIHKYSRTKILGTGLGTRKPRFMDVTGLDYREMETKVAGAIETFQELPSEIRTKFQNRVDLLLDFIGKDENHAEAIKLGIIPEPEEIKPEKPILVKWGDKTPGPTIKQADDLKGQAQHSGS